MHVRAECLLEKRGLHAILKKKRCTCSNFRCGRIARPVGGSEVPETTRFAMMFDQFGSLNVSNFYCGKKERKDRLTVKTSVG